MFVNKPSVTDYMPKFVKEKVRYATRISRYLEKLKHSKDNKTIKGSSTSLWKLCVRPYQPKDKTKTDPTGVIAWIAAKFFKKHKHSSEYDIYFYDEVQGKIGTSIGYQLPGHIVTNTLKLLEEREKRVEAQTMQNEKNESLKAEKTESTNMEDLNNSTRKKSFMPTRPDAPNMSRRASDTPNMSRRASLRVATLEDKVLSNLSADKVVESKGDINIKDIHDLKEILGQMMTFVDDIKTKIEDQEASKL